MPFRVMSYDGASYRKQLLENKKQIVPVITIVLYFGTEHRWNKAKNIKSLMTIPEGLEDFVNDYKIHVSEIACLTDKQISMFQSDFKIVANFFAQKRKNKDYVPQDSTEIKHVDEVLKLLSVMTGDHRYEDILSESNGKEGVKNMCDVAERIENKGRAEERLEAIRNMIELGLTKEKILLRYSEEEYEKAEQSMLTKA